MIRFLEIQSPNCRETLHRPQPKAILVSKKTVAENPEAKKKAHLHKRNQVFPISIMEILLNWVLLASL